MAVWAKLTSWLKPAETPEHLLSGRLGEAAAREHLRQKGLKFLTANFSSKRGEIDLIFRDGDCLVFVEVKTRAPDGWTRPEKAVTPGKKRKIARAASDYLRLLDDPRVAYRYDIVEVFVLNGVVQEIRHIENAFNTQNLWKPKRR